MRLYCLPAPSTIYYLNPEVVKHDSLIAFSGLGFIVRRKICANLFLEVIKRGQQVRHFSCSSLKTRYRAGDCVDINTNNIGTQTQSFHHRGTAAYERVEHGLTLPVVGSLIISGPKIRVLWQCCCY
jgi:hypothetical protein